MSTDELVTVVERAGGTLILQGEKVKYQLPDTVAHLAAELKERKPELVALLQRRGGRVAAFPHCPHCANYALYRKDNVGAYECQTCGLQNIAEQIARRLM
jgi:Zn ribbon nucleic-acid-binding protein